MQSLIARSADAAATVLVFNLTTTKALRTSVTDLRGLSVRMANSAHMSSNEKDQIAQVPDLRRLLASRTRVNTDVVQEYIIRLNSLYGKDTPKDRFIATSAPPLTTGVVDTHSLEEEKYLTNTTLVESTYSEEAIRGSDNESPIDGLVLFHEDTVKDNAGSISMVAVTSYIEKMARAIIKFTDPAFNSHFGSHFDKEVPDYLEL